ncbi:MAG: ATP-binding protein [Magnetospirillum sp.]|nr:ATP-binding protein [Magnetospirillum sp.]
MHDREQIFRALLGTMDQGFCIVEVIFDELDQPVDYRFVEVNGAFERDTGLQGAVGRRMREMRPDHEESWFQTYGRIARTGVSERFESYAAALRRWYDVHAIRVGAPELHRVAIVFDDVTSRKAAETALRQSEARFRMLFDSMSEGFVIADLLRDATGQVYDLRYVEVSPSFQRLTGRTPQQVVGHTTREVFGEVEDHWVETWRQAGRGIHSRTEGYSGALGQWFQASTTPLSENRIAVLFTDISEQHRRELGLKDARTKAEAASASKSKFLAAASHDLRQPVQSLILFAQVLASRLAGHPAEPVVAKMSGALDTFTDLLDSLLDISKLDAGLVVPDVRAHPVTAILQELADAYQPRMAAKGLRLKRHLTDAWAMVDATLLRRIVSNLLDNALKYTPQGGVLLACHRVGEMVRIEVVDTGVGIPAEHLDAIFEEFVQVGEIGREHKQGMGLGLATVKRLANLLNYSLSVRSCPGHGSRFTVDIPPTAARANPEAAPAADTIARRVLVVDDDSTIVEGMKALLEAAGYEVLTASQAEEALTLLQGERAPDAVVTDFRLGGAFTGIRLIEEARRRTGRKLPGLVITGDTTVRPGAEISVLHKPVPPELLTKALADICH